MYLSDRDIKKAIAAKKIFVDPLFPDSIEGATLTVHLGNNFKIYNRSNHTFIDLTKPVDEMMEDIIKEEFMLHPGEFVLGVTIEKVGVDASHIGILDGKSSVGRLGTTIHVTASRLNPGNRLCMTLELHNLGALPIKLLYGMPIGEISFMQLTSEAEKPYNGKYPDGNKPTASQYYKNCLEGKNSWMAFAAKLKEEKI